MKDERITNEAMNYMRAKVFYNLKSIVHVTKKDGIFYNGRIFEVGDDFIIIHDREDGRQLVLFIEIKGLIEEYKTGGEGE